MIADLWEGFAAALDAALWTLDRVTEALAISADDLLFGGPVQNHTLPPGAHGNAPATPELFPHLPHDPGGHGTGMPGSVPGGHGMGGGFGHP
jgi:hypothetical protein